MYNKDTLKSGISITENHIDTIVWVKLDKKFFNLDEDVFICGTYIWVEESPAYNIVNVTLFDLLECDVTRYKELGSVFVCGDFNSRFVSRNDYITHDIHSVYIDNIDYIPDTPLVRASPDSSVNSHSLKLLDLCKSTGLRILNGRLSDTSNFSFISHTGASVIDYLLTSEHEFSKINSCRIDPLTVFSDHCPVRFSLSCCFTKPKQENETVTRICWNTFHRDQFRAGLISKLPDIK